MVSVRSRPERVRQAVLLAAVGGFLDGYSFLAHGGVFANAQTGNVVLFGVEASQGNFGSAVRHLPPLAAFIVGMITVEVLARQRHHALLRRPSRVVLGTEIVVFTIVGVLPASAPDFVSTVLVAWAATLQVGTFRNVRGVSYNTTFTTGNLRSLVSETSGWLLDRDDVARSRARALLCVVLGFSGGAVLGGLATRWLDVHAILLAVPALALLLVQLVVETGRLERAGS